MSGINVSSSTGKERTSLAIFGSGRGSNARAIIEYFKNKASIEVGLLVTNTPESGIVNLGVELDLPVMVLDRKAFYTDGEACLLRLKEQGIDYISLAGFLWLIPKAIIKHFEHRIFNIHPALLPKYGGKGMYGMNIHNRVCDNGDIVTGVTIHLVNEKYDEGEILFQKEVGIKAGEKPEIIARKVLILEHYYYPRTIEKYIKGTSINRFSVRK